MPVAYIYSLVATSELGGQRESEQQFLRLSRKNSACHNNDWPEWIQISHPV